MAKVVAVIQARMGSHRLPGKVLRPLAGRPMLWHIVHRLRRCERVDEVVVATTTQAADDPVAAFCEREGVAFVRGSEEDVLSRFLLAARRHAADVVVRVNGDAPLVCPHTVDRLVAALLAAGTDYCTGEPEPPCIHAGFDPVTTAALERLAAEAGDDPVAREHVTAYFKAHPDFATTTFVPIPPEHLFAGARVSVDTPADLAFLEAVHETLGAAPGEVDMAALVRLLKERPELLAINAHVHQKQVTVRSREALVRCDGDAGIGMGHVVRCLAIAEALREDHGVGVRFALAEEGPGAAAVRAAGFGVAIRPPALAEGPWLDALVAERAPDTILVDLRNELPAAALQGWRDGGTLVVVIDDPSPRRLAADLAFFPPVPQLADLSWQGFDGALVAGWEWLPLRRAFAGLRRPPSGPVPHVLVSAGGSDPGGLTMPIVRALSRVSADFTATVVIGAAYPHEAALAALLAPLGPRFALQRAVADMAGLMRSADLAVASFGITAYELAAAGVPSVLLGLSEDHARSATALAAAGVALSLGVHTQIREPEIAEAVGALLADSARREEMSRRAMALIDGRGAGRIAARIQTELDRKSP